MPETPPAGAEFLQLDLTQPWPWDDDSADEIIADNALEHFDNRELTFFLSEALRVLKPGAALTGNVPDFAEVWRRYEEAHPWEDAPTGDLVGPYMEPAMNALYNYAYGWGHKQVFTLSMIEARLQQAGFEVDVVRGHKPWALHCTARKPVA